MLSIVAVDGNVLYRGGVGGEVNPGDIDVVTTDFVMSGGAGYRYFVDLPSPLGAPLRAEVADFARDQGRIDHSAFARGRYVNCLEDAANPICPR